jgi:hypothetical protein
VSMKSKCGRCLSDRIGSTWVVNPGSDKQRPHLLFIDTEDVGAMKHSLYGGVRLAESSQRPPPGTRA